ncbi:hypothetical protein LguiB_024960 [Lonicera macranthoides]
MSCGSGVSARAEAEQYGKDLEVLKELVKELYPKANTQPKVLGPGGFYDANGSITSFRLQGQMLYLDQLGMTSTFNHKRASMASPNGKECPIYNSQWLPLFARLFSLFKEKGEQRLQFSSSIFLYSAFETNTNLSHFGQPGISMLLINMLNSTIYEVSIENDVNLHPRRLLEDKENGGGQRGVPFEP